jgi:hypothetical protein
MNTNYSLNPAQQETIRWAQHDVSCVLDDDLQQTRELLAIIEDLRQRLSEK